MNKKTCIVTIVGIALIALIGGLAFVGVVGNSKATMARTFLREMYQVSSHDRYQSLQKNLDAIQAGDDSTSSRDIAFADYEELFDPLATSECYERLSSNTSYLRAAQFASDNGYLFEVKSVALQTTYAEKEKVQYDYTVVISAVPQNGTAATDITAEGNLVLVNDEDGVFRVNNFKPYNLNLYMDLIAK